MAAIDHTAHARPSVRNEPPSQPDPFTDRQCFPQGLGLEKLEGYGSKRAGIALAIGVIRGLLERSESFKRNAAPGRPSTMGFWPLNPVHATGLNVAIYLLQQHADMLEREPGG
jgi:hypothetical protein